MTQPLVVNIPHKLGKDEAKRRIAGGIGRLASHIPGGAAEVSSSWEGDRLKLFVKAMGDSVSGHIDVEESLVRLEILLPALLGIFAQPIANFLRSKGGELLEDKRT